MQDLKTNYCPKRKQNSKEETEEELVFAAAYCDLYGVLSTHIHQQPHATCIPLGDANLDENQMQLMISICKFLKLNFTKEASEFLS